MFDFLQLHTYLFLARSLLDFYHCAPVSISFLVLLTYVYQVDIFSW